MAPLQGRNSPWAGATHTEGGFNVYNTNMSDDTLYPMHHYSPVLDIESGKPLDSALTEQGYLINSGSSWMFVVKFGEGGLKPTVY